MGSSLRGLALGLGLIALASAVLLFSDRDRRVARAKSDAVATERSFRIGLVYFAPEEGFQVCHRGLMDGLRAHGFEEGRNLEVVRAHAQAEIAMIPTLLQDFDSRGLDLIVTFTTPCLTAACSAVRNTPVVFTYVYDPIAAGAGTSFADHLPFVTGVGSFPPVAETVDLIQELVPGARRIGSVHNSAEANSEKVLNVARPIFEQKGLALEEVTVSTTAEVLQATQATVARGADAIWITGDNTVQQAFSSVVQAARAANIPIVTNIPEQLVQGALAAVGIAFYDSGVAAAELAARVLKGESPSQIPFRNVAAVWRSVNIDVARELGLEVPESVLSRADEVIDSSGRLARSATATHRDSGDVAALDRTWKLDLIEYTNMIEVDEMEAGIRAGLAEAGLVAGRDFELRVRNAQGDMATLSILVDAAISEGTDLLLTLSTPALQATAQRARGRPVVFSLTSNPFLAGVGTSNRDHLPNVTGVPTPSAYEELVQLMLELMPEVQRIGTLTIPAEANSVFNTQELGRVAQRAGLELVSVAANTSSEVSDAALALTSQDIDAVAQVAGSLTTTAFVAIMRAAERRDLPVFGFISSNVRQGAVAAQARDYEDAGRKTGHMAARVMRGEDPARMPFEPDQSTRLLVNPEAARRAGIVLPSTVLARAAETVGE